MGTDATRKSRNKDQFNTLVGRNMTNGRVVVLLIAAVMLGSQIGSYMGMKSMEDTLLATTLDSASSGSNKGGGTRGLQSSSATSSKKDDESTKAMGMSSGDGATSNNYQWRNGETPTYDGSGDMTEKEGEDEDEEEDEAEYELEEEEEEEEETDEVFDSEYGDERADEDDDDEEAAEDDRVAEMELMDEQGGSEEDDDQDGDQSGEERSETDTEVDERGDETESDANTETETETANPPPVESEAEKSESVESVTAATTTATFSDEDTSIRRWGCARNETPFIFVHIGKAGGGGVRSRMAAAALDYNRSGWHRTHEDSSYYYPMYDTRGNLHKGIFSTSKHCNFVPESLTEYHGDFAYEGFGPCAATTPLGGALACPMDAQSECKWAAPNQQLDNRCDIVYMGHNVIGSELHWLPTDYLVDWWQTTEWGKQPNDFLGRALKDRNAPTLNLHRKALEIVGEVPELKCPEAEAKYRVFKRYYAKCYQKKEAIYDKITKHVLGDDPVQFGAQVLASMPIMRVTVMREPFSWLTSKFFWHTMHNSRNGGYISPDAGPKKNGKLTHYNKANNRETPPFVKCDDVDEAAYGWASFRAMTYIFYLCGEHCMGGWADGSMTIEDMERQSAYNLRNSFAVVGLLHKTDDFYDMVTQRVYYMNTTLNAHVHGKKHGSGDHEEALRCKAVYKDPEFQAKMTAKSPALAALSRLYQIAVEVNEFQEKELAECAAN